LGSKFKLVLASNKDKALLLTWRNERTARINSFDQKKITKKKHEIWFNKKIKQKNLIWIFKYNNKKCGMVKLEKKLGKMELGYLIQKNFRGKKFAEKMLKLFLKKYKKYIKKKYFLLAKSKKLNFRSNLSLINSGFKKYKENKKYFTFRYDFK